MDRIDFFGCRLMRNVFFIGLVLGMSSAISADEPVDFARDIQPIFQKHCITCHGSEKQESGLRLDSPRFVKQGGDRGAAFAAGKSAESLLYQSITGKGDVSEMPAEGPKLNPDQIALIRRWIEEGAKLPKAETIKNANGKSDHWAFRPIVRPAVPSVQNSGWARNPIDRFVLAKLEQEGLTPSPDADRYTLIRRLSFDLRGLPPTWEEAEAFVQDSHPDAYERLVERMLASPQYGERWGRHWLDVARYADSNGFTIDGPRSIWKYRDWVIDAFNRDVPFDQFTIEQLAGDLLPNPTPEQLIATGFHRNTLINQEGGTDQEQFRIEAVGDRVNTTGTVWMGLTVGCAQCHQHKFDPISQREYYELFAFFNNQDEPTLQVPTGDQTQRLKKLDQAIAAAEKPLQAHDAEFAKGLEAWEQNLAGQIQSAPEWTVLKPSHLETEKGSVLAAQENEAIFVDFSGPDSDTFLITANLPMEKVTAIRLEALTHISLPNKGPGRGGNGNFVLNEFEVLQGSGDAKTFAPVKLAHAVADHSQDNYPVTDAIDGKREKTGWAINLKGGNFNVDREAIFFPAAPISAEKGSAIQIQLHQNHGSKYTLGHFRLSVSHAMPESLMIPAPIRRILEKPRAKRTKTEQAQLLAAYRDTDTERKPLAEKVAGLKRDRDDVAKAVPTTMILRERVTPRETHIHVRGDFLRKGAQVTPDVPDVLPALESENEIPNRLELAKWLLDPAHPLTARVTVNRIWQRYFGLGFVETENDFGTQSTPPSHPELLDWLASEFRRTPQSEGSIKNPNAWSMKSLHRLIVTSATYRQSSRLRPELAERDPRNRLLARQTRMRIAAEAVRDVSLAASGLLSTKMHGPGVHPPQPEGIYVLTQQKKPWPDEKGLDRYRRAVYTYFWRSSPYPMLVTFDASDATTSCTRRPRSNTPLQALTLANDHAFVEMAQALALRILKEAPAYEEGRLRHAFHVAFTREPSEKELAVLLPFIEKQRAEFEKNPQAAALAAPKDCPKDISPAEAATWVAAARVLLNLDEFITRE